MKSTITSFFSAQPSLKKADESSAGTACAAAGSSSKSDIITVSDVEQTKTILPSPDFVSPEKKLCDFATRDVKIFLASFCPELMTYDVLGNVSFVEDLHLTIEINFQFPQ